MIGRCKSKWKTARDTVEEIRADLNPFFTLPCSRISSHVFISVDKSFLKMSGIIQTNDLPIPESKALLREKGETVFVF
ncbi:hypothetical protein CHH59_19355 [Shouchella clausii]|uniref:Uncharacterized protein n=1 Tax=Shouchella clausii TaxID=79880 RepID=A0A268S2H9_SHOCL|nr:hypothetical protein CHH74_06555 [Shouchella clausii]PAD43297.1 hypothetical protein CHH54_07585 [Bacillus sp. 7520-S]PAE98100.1 hypothetical protein CHH71_06160 [Shouchella clausii]PAF12290.1 hypothetical protein CHH59_19355 [Shouchella clausii]PAF26725.1 hypothetical protein CHH61_07030 [Shouchella clausii]